ncbi:MAG TPA: methylmalonyl-CoA mutase family protein, partial [Chitinophagales bacterium]|nr:methylmalonyl-CoA mutase family protein [Chitinophagales bacterium]
MQVPVYKPRNHVRIVTAASLFDGHDAAINIMRRMMQASGAEVIHIGHDRSVKEIVDCAIQEDAQAIAVTSYQGGHMEFLKYMKDLLKENHAGHIRIFAGGGGTILPDEIEELHQYGITRVYSPDDGRAMGLQGMINDLLKACDFSPLQPPPLGEVLKASSVSHNGEIIHLLEKKDKRLIAQLISLAENEPEIFEKLKSKIREAASGSLSKGWGVVLGITGTGGAGKSSLVDELVRRFTADFKDKTVGILSVDPSKRKTGGALLGDRIRMNALSERVYMRSLATRQANLAVSKYITDAIDILKAAKYDLIILETSGIGQADTEIVDIADVSLYVMTPEYGAATQLEKIDMLDFADAVAINKCDKRGSQDALRDVRKQYKRNRQLFTVKDEELPVFGTIASQFNDPGMNRLYKALTKIISEKTGVKFQSTVKLLEGESEKIHIIPANRIRYLSEIAENNRRYDAWVKQQAEIAGKLFSLKQTIEMLEGAEKSELREKLEAEYRLLEKQLEAECKKILESWQQKVKQYKDDYYLFHVRGREVKVKTFSETLSHTRIPKVALPKYQSWADILRWSLQENVPGEFPYTAGVFPFKREEEDPTRMFAGEGGPERTNKRFHYLSRNMPARRLSTAFDSVTLYGRDPDLRPDIYGKVGNSGVSICCLDDAKKLYSGFNLCDPKTSVSMTINGPAATITAFFMNAAIDQQCELYIRQHGLEKEVREKIQAYFKHKGFPQPEYQGELPEGNDGLGLMLLGITGDKVLPGDVYEKIKAGTLSQVRGTVQADILKEDQAQNTCIFSTEFSLKLMGDVQEYFVKHKVRNFYSVSISGYHIAEAGANPVTQLAFTLANGFTYVEYYLSKGMKIDDFAP